MDNEDRTEDKPVVSAFPTARVADSYGTDPHEHKPSQDLWDPETADEKQADTGENAEPAGEDEPSAGTSSSSSETSNENSPEKTSPKPAPRTESRTAPDLTGGSTARSTGTGRPGKAKGSN